MEQSKYEQEHVLPVEDMLSSTEGKGKSRHASEGKSHHLLSNSHTQCKNNL